MLNISKVKSLFRSILDGGLNDNEELSNKRFAKRGQWQTPPMPAFSSKPSIICKMTNKSSDPKVENKGDISVKSKGFIYDHHMILPRKDDNIEQARNALDPSLLSFNLSKTNDNNSIEVKNTNNIQKFINPTYIGCKESRMLNEKNVNSSSNLSLFNTTSISVKKLAIGINVSLNQNLSNHCLSTATPSREISSSSKTPDESETLSKVMIFYSPKHDQQKQLFKTKGKVNNLTRNNFLFVNGTNATTDEEFVSGNLNLNIPIVIQKPAYNSTILKSLLIKSSYIECNRESEKGYRRLPAHNQQIVSNFPSLIHPPTSSIYDDGIDESTSMLRSRTKMIPYVIDSGTDEAKRVKRLVQNRASARLRRWRKKNLVDSYEGEVNLLETSLLKLRAHRWGVGTDPSAFLDVLSIDGENRNISTEKKNMLIASILHQQREQVRNIIDCQMENFVLSWMVQYEQKNIEQNGSEISNLASELNDLLQLSPYQKVQLSNIMEGVEEEVDTMDTIDMCLKSMEYNRSFMNPGVEECTEQFTSILNTTQMSKFLLWIDNNSEIVDSLDYVNVSSESKSPSHELLFIFGLNKGMHGVEVK